MNIKAVNPTAQSPAAAIKLRCPICRQRGTFEHIGGHDISLTTPGGYRTIGYRRCPDPSCQALVFFAFNPQSGSVELSFPPERVDFDPTNIPAAVINALEEAVTCHANACFTASAIMVRKTLEELCRDKGAQGKNLKERIKELGTKVILPADLLDGLDDLRLLGNDAAHIESQEYNQIGKEEVEVGLELAKEVLKAVYQYSALLGRLRALKKGP